MKVIAQSRVSRSCFRPIAQNDRCLDVSLCMTLKTLRMRPLDNDKAGAILPDDYRMMQWKAAEKLHYDGAENDDNLAE